MKRLFTPEYKAAWDRCLNLARTLCYVRNEERRAELKMQLEEATAKKEEIRIREERNKAIKSAKSQTAQHDNYNIIA